MSRIVVGIDGSEASRRALGWAAQEAKLRGAVLRVVHTWQAAYAAPGPTPQMDPKYSGDAVETERRIAEGLVERELDAIESHLAGVRVEREVAQASPAKILLAAAEGSEILVLGSSRHGALAGVVLGAVGQECIQHAPCPVVIVRATGR